MSIHSIEYKKLPTNKLMSSNVKLMSSDFCHMCSWVTTEDERVLYTKALALGADSIVLATKNSSSIFVDLKEKPGKSVVQ